MIPPKVLYLLNILTYKDLKRSINRTISHSYINIRSQIPKHFKNIVNIDSLEEARDKEIHFADKMDPS